MLILVIFISVLNLVILSHQCKLHKINYKKYLISVIFYGLEVINCVIQLVF